MDFKQLADRVKALFGNRGGAQGVKEDASEVRDVYQSDGTTEDKLKDSAEAIREPGADQQGAGAGAPVQEDRPAGTEQGP